MSEREFTDRVVSEGADLTWYALRLTRDVEGAKDLVQDSILKALTNRSRFRPGSDLRAWMHTLAKNMFINGYRRRKLGRRLEGDIEVNRGLVRRARSSDDPWSELRLNEVSARIDTLRSGFRDAFLLHSEGFKYEEIAERMSVPVGTVKSRIHEARQKLRSALGPGADHA